MWEFSLACNNKNRSIINYINQCFCQDFPDCMLTSYSDSHFTYLLFAGDDAIENICKDKIKQCVITYIIDVFKYDYFSKFISNKPDSLIMKAYIKALTLYDVETDIILIKQSINLNRIFYLDSFFNFRIADIIRMWKELCELIKSNINYLNNDMMIDIIKSFISTFAKTSGTLKIIIKKKSFVLYKLKDNAPPIKLKDNIPAIDVINYALLSNPERIEIYGSNTESGMMINLLKSLYNEKVKIVN